MHYITYVRTIRVYRLFQVIVDTDRTASHILSIMNKQKMGGEVTFLPLNKLQPPRPTYPRTEVQYGGMTGLMITAIKT